MTEKGKKGKRRKEEIWQKRLNENCYHLTP